MPTQLGSANLVPLNLHSLGMWGLNLQAQHQPIDPRWCTQADNLVFDTKGRLSLRAGLVEAISTGGSGSWFDGKLFEYTNTSGTTVMIVSWGAKIYTWVEGSGTITNVTGSLTITANNWKFVNFNGLCYGLQTGHPLIVYTGSGNFTTVAAASGSVPNGNELLSAFGRLWGSDSTGQILQYSQLLDATNWNVTGAGSFNLTSVWANGTDQIVSLVAFNNYLLVFGTRNIIVWQDGSGSVLGMNPINMAVLTQLAGIGAVNRDVVQNIAGSDVAFLDNTGVHSLQRALTRGADVLQNFSTNVRDDLITTLTTLPTLGGATQITSAYSPVYGFYILSFGTGTLTRTSYIFDTRLTLPDGAWRVTKWPWADNLPVSFCAAKSNLAMYILDQAGNIDTYGAAGTPGGIDNSNIHIHYAGSYTSPWLLLNDEVAARIKMLKRIEVTIETAYTQLSTTAMQFRWAYDFNPTYFSTTVLVPPAGAGGTPIVNVSSCPGSSNGKYIRFGLDWQGDPTNGGNCSFIDAQIYSKIGRIA